MKNWKKVIDLDYAIADREKEAVNTANRTKKFTNERIQLCEVEQIDISMFVGSIRRYFDKYVDILCAKKGMDPQKSILNILEESQESLIYDFDFAKYYRYIKCAEKVDLSIEAFWENLDSKLSGIDIQIFNGNDIVKTVRLLAAKSWKATVRELPKYDRNDKKIIYTIGRLDEKDGFIYYAQSDSKNETSKYIDTLFYIYNENPEFRKQILNLVQYELIREHGKIVGTERALLLDMIMLVSSPEIAASYSSYNGKTDPRWLRFAKVYLSLPNSTKSIYWYPNYFNDDKKTKYCVEEYGSALDSVCKKSEENEQEANESKGAIQLEKKF